MGMVPALRQGNYPGFGVLVRHLAVTNVIARDAGRGEWGFPKFVADMKFSITPEYFECRMSEGQEDILDIHVARKGVHLRDSKPLVTYTVRGRKLIRTVVRQKGVMRVVLKPRDSFINFSNHPVSRSILDLDISRKPFMSVYYPERAGILPSGEVIEKNVRPFKGHGGKSGKADHVVEYTGFGF